MWVLLWPQQLYELLGEVYVESVQSSNQTKLIP